MGSENTMIERLFDGFVLTQERFNSLVDTFKGLNVQKSIKNGDILTFNDGSTLTFEKRNDTIKRAVLKIKEKAYLTPLTSNDNLTYTNDYLKEVDVHSNIQVMDQNGVNINPSDYTILNTGEIVFKRAVNYPKIQVSNMDFYLTETYEFERDEYGKIVSSNMNFMNAILFEEMGDVRKQTTSTREDYEILIWMGV